ncbi:MAG TPA: class I SAM-dependent methyltransferase [Gemmatimonadales bacterium]|nr:class I SAM-dependent methyltransferase [Gemmatimonadales bacterium]
MTDPPGLGSLDPESHLRDPARKQRYVTTLFDTVAPSYDRFTRWFSAGMDARWKRLLARWAVEGLGPGDLVADLACGTGDLLAAVRQAGGPAVELVGLDPSRGMLARASDRVRAESVRRSGGPPVRLVRADMLALPLPAAGAAAVTVGYGFRNVPSLPRALDEARRVLRPAGRLVSLDFFLPDRGTWRRLFRWYLRRAGRLAGRWWHGEPEAYGYIDRSLEGWLTPARFATALGRAGFTVERVARRLGGGICLHQARKTEGS